MFQTHRLGLLIEAQLKAGQLAATATTLDEAFAMSEQSGQRSFDAELHRLRGEWLVQSGVKSEESAADAAFAQAIKTARSQEARSFELRAVTSLCRLWQCQGKRREAHQLLAEIYGWFTEGFDTVDLQAAKALLAALT
jgi:adenylate cyclase